MWRTRCRLTNILQSNKTVPSGIKYSQNSSCRRFFWTREDVKAPFTKKPIIRKVSFETAISYTIFDLPIRSHETGESAHRKSVGFFNWFLGWFPCTRILVKKICGFKTVGIGLDGRGLVCLVKCH